MEQRDEELLKGLARKYIWWKTPEEALRAPQRIIAQVMNIGDYHDVQILANHLGNDALRQAIAHAEAGQFDERSWAYWHYRLELADVGEIPPLPARMVS